MAAKKETAAKATEAKKEAPKKRAAAKKPAAEKSVSHIFEIDGEQINTDDISQKIQEAYKADGHQIGRMKSVEVYYNFGERRAYYVINGKSEDKFVEF